MKVLRRIRPLVLAAACVAPALVHCSAATLPPEGQLLVYVDTDAPLPSEPGTSDDGAPLALFDAVRIEVVDRGSLAPACSECQRDFDVSTAARKRGISFGVVPSVNGDSRMVRVRFFRRLASRGGELPPSSVLEGRFELPSVAAEGIAAWTASVSLESLGRNLDVRPMQAGRTAPLDTHPGVLPKTCSLAARANEVCVPGGAFWMHSGLYLFRASGVPSDERVVSVSPFFLDEHEVTVAELRASGTATAGDPFRSEAQGCSYTDAPGDHDDLPVNCISALAAEVYCASLGKRLPSEAEYEYAASLGGRSPFVWGSDEPQCEHAVFLRAPLPGEPALPAPPCSAWGGTLGRAGSTPRDAANFGSGRALDLVGNVSEWTRDSFASDGDDCMQPGFYRDPVCRPDQPSGPPVAKGGNWMQAAFPSYIRRSVRATSLNTTMGFRCARAGSE